MIHWLMAFLLLASFPVAGANLALDPTKSRVGFTYQQMGSSVEGEFKRYTANVQFDPAHPEAGHVVFRIYPAGTDAGNADANNELLLPTFFDVRRFPEAMFESTRIQALANGRYDVTGKLTLKGVTRPMSTTAQVKANGSALQLMGEFHLKRLDFGIGSGIWSDDSVLGNDVRVSYSLRLLPALASKKK